MSKPKLTDIDFCRAAKKLKCEVAAIKAVSAVESRGEGFYSNGFPVILFERHIFRKYTNGKYTKSHPHLSGPAGNYGAAGQNQRNKFNEAFALDPQAAMMSCSWGKFQIMGFNYKVAGYKNVGEFVDAMKESEGKHLDAFVNFVIGNKLDKYLRALNWAAFAERYNGAGYRKNQYDTKMANQYKKFSKENIDCGNLKPIETKPLDPVAEPITTESDVKSEVVTETVTEKTADTTTVTETTTSETKVVEAPAKEGAVGDATKMTIAGITIPTFLAVIFKAIGDLIAQGYVETKEIGNFVFTLITNNLKWVFLCVGLIIILLIIRKAFKQVTLLYQMKLAGDKNSNDVVVKAG